MIISRTGHVILQHCMGVSQLESRPRRCLAETLCPVLHTDSPKHGTQSGVCPLASAGRHAIQASKGLSQAVVILSPRHFRMPLKQAVITPHSVFNVFLLPTQSWVSFCLEVFHKQHSDGGVKSTVTVLWSVSKLLQTRLEPGSRPVSTLPSTSPSFHGPGKAWIKFYRPLLQASSDFVSRLPPLKWTPFGMMLKLLSNNLFSTACLWGFCCY
jgi:hypothetical protein